MDKLVLNHVSFIGEEKLLNKVIKLMMSENSSNISNLLPLPKDLNKNRMYSFPEKLKNYNKYKVSTYLDWINTYWGNEEFGDITLINAENKKITFNFSSEFSDSKIILINIQKKYPKLKVKAVFLTEDEFLNERFETKMIKGEVFYTINNGVYCKYISSIQLRINEIKNDCENFGYSNVA